MELYLSDHPATAAARRREMQEMAGEVGAARDPLLPVGAAISARRCDTSNPYFDFDPAKCIVCSRCVRACDEVQGTFALTIAGRGFGSHVSASQDEPFLASECVSCGACVQACPTGSLQEKAVKRDRPARAQRRHHLRLLRRRLHLQGGDARRGGRPHGAVEGRQGQSRPQLRQGPLRLGLCHPPRARSSSR